MALFAGEALNHHVLSVSLASAPDDDVVFTNIAGFVVMYVHVRSLIAMLCAAVILLCFCPYKTTRTQESKQYSSGLTQRGTSLDSMRVSE